MVTTTTERRIAVQTAEDHLRRAAQAEREGVRILVDHRTGQHVATSASDPTRCYHVTPTGCTCRGFTSWKRCKHHSLLLADLGRIPDPAPAAPVALPGRCPACDGLGEVMTGHATMYGAAWAPCGTCQGSGRTVPAVPAAA